MNRQQWEAAVAFHGHECPGLAVGARACEAAERKLGITRVSDEEVVCVTENDACGVDAVQAILGCSFGKGNLVYRDTGKMAFSFFCRGNGRKLRAYFKGAMPPGMDRKAYQQHILTAPLDEVFDFSEPSFDLPEKARRFTSVTCGLCGEKAPEHKMRLQDGRTVCLDCFKDYGRGLS
jgi:formylmethanofuran dehydrogenase subunit E